MFNILPILFGLLVSPANAQTVTCATRPNGDASNACASTAFVANPANAKFPTFACGASQWVRSAALGVAVCAQPALTDLSDLSAKLPGLSSSVAGTGIPGLSGGLWFIYNTPNTVPTYIAGFRTQFDPDYTGGAAGVVRNGHWNLCSVGAGVADYIWCGLDTLTNSATGGQNVARYFKAIKKSGAGPTWGFVSEMVDDSGNANPAASLTNEIDLTVNGTDNSFQRVGINFVASTYGAGATGHVGRGLMFSSAGGAIWDNLIGGPANVGNGLNTSGFTLTGAAVLLGSGQKIGFESDNLHNLSHSGGILSYSVSGTSMLQVFDGGAVRIAQVSSDPGTAAFAGSLYFNTSSNHVKAYNGSAWRTVSELETAQTWTADQTNSRWLVSAANPTASSCGTSPVVDGGSGNQGGKITFGSATTACTLTFATAFPTNAYCTVTPMAQPAAVGSIPYISAQSRTAFTISGGVASASYQYTCQGN